MAGILGRKLGMTQFHSEDGTVNRVTAVEAGPCVVVAKRTKERDGYTLVATAMYWKACWVKLEFHLAKGKKSFDKRDDIKDRDWSREKERMMKHSKR